MKKIIESIKFIFRFIDCLCLLVFVSLPLTITGAIILLPVSACFDIGKLPFIFRWFDSADPYIGRDITVIIKINKGTYWTNYSPLWKIWFDKYCWLAFRNPINYFSYVYLSFAWKTPKLLNYIGDDRIGDSTGDHPGFKYIEVEQDNQKYYEYYYIYKWNAQKCLRFRMGYKIGNPVKNKNGEIQQEVLVLQPYKKYSGV